MPHCENLPTGTVLRSIRPTHGSDLLTCHRWPRRRVIGRRLREGTWCTSPRQPTVYLHELVNTNGRPICGKDDILFRLMSSPSLRDSTSSVVHRLTLSVSLANHHGFERSGTVVFTWLLFYFAFGLIQFGHFHQIVSSCCDLLRCSSPPMVHPGTFDPRTLFGYINVR